MRIGVIGAGASGLMVSGFLAKEHDVTVFDVILRICVMSRIF